MTLFDLALKKVSAEMLDINDSDELTFDTKYEQKADVIVRLMYPSASRLERLSFPFVEEAFRDKSRKNIKDELRKKLGSEEFPEGLMAGLSEGIYRDKYNNLDKTKRLIIKLLSVYIIISI